jgi:hypothetical protein
MLQKRPKEDGATESERNNYCPVLETVTPKKTYILYLLTYLLSIF